MRRSLIVFVMTAVLFVCSNTTSSAQDNDVAELWSKVNKLFNDGNRLDALPLLEQLVKLDAKNSESFFRLGDSLFVASFHTEDEQRSKQMRIRAREAFVKARELGDKSALLSIMIDGIPADGGPKPRYSSVAAANISIVAGELAFTSGKIDEALSHYQKALEYDPKSYFAALFSGNMYLMKSNYPLAEEWFQKAIVIDPFIETAYRYSATPLMRQGKVDLARDRYIDAWITQPYSRLAIQGLMNWAEVAGVRLSHPRVDRPTTKVGADGKESTNITLSLNDDGSIGWLGYSSARIEWQKEKFKTAFPNETTYRRSLPEELDALRRVVRMARSMKPNALNEQIAMIEKMDNDGLLEAFILLSIADEGILKDHRGYLAANRQKMRDYVIKYVIRK